jgi:hypothetical protein
MNSDEMTKSLSGLLQEAYEGADSSFFSDAEKGGLLRTLSELSAEQASRPIVADGLTVAAHAEHLRWSLANLNATTRGAAWNPNWAESWRVRQVDPTEWDALRSKLRHEYETTLEAMRSLDAAHLEPMMFTGVVATIAHAAYHLGAIRATLNALPEA